jgi:hypothetical protein
VDEGLISVLATPSLDSKTCPDNHAEGACERLEWNLHRFKSDVLAYEWSYNEVKENCDSSLFVAPFERIWQPGVTDAEIETETETDPEPQIEPEPKPEPTINAISSEISGGASAYGRFSSLFVAVVSFFLF